MPRVMVGNNVFEVSKQRIRTLYEQGHDIVVAFSAGKDSGIVLELAILVAKERGKLPVKVQMVDEEILYPGTHEYALRTANRKEVDFHWVIANQPNINIFNRKMPYWWAFDRTLKPEEWITQPPSFARYSGEIDLFKALSLEEFPAPNGKDMVALFGIRTAESSKRLLGLTAMFSNPDFNFVTGKKQEDIDRGISRMRGGWVIYDWKVGDIWRAYKENNWDYNRCYNTLFRMGMTGGEMRVGPIGLIAGGVVSLGYAARAWPEWFDRVCVRLPGSRTAAHFGLRAVRPNIRVGETWKSCYQRTCIDDAPEWIKERAAKVRENVLRRHGTHSSAPFPEIVGCHSCGLLGSWQKISHVMFNGDPFSFECGLPYMEPEYFRPGAGTWKGAKPLIKSF